MYKKLIPPAIALSSATVIALLVPWTLLTFKERWLLFFTSFAVVYIMAYLVTEYFVFRELRKLEDAVKPSLEDKNILLIPEPNFNLRSAGRVWNHTKILLRQKDDRIRKLEQMADFRKRFIADVSHELKSPIFNAQGYIHTLMDGAVKDKSVRDRFLHKASKSIDHLDVLVQDLLLLSQIETGNIRMLFDYFDLVGLVKEVFEHYEHQAAKSGITLNLSSHQEGHMIVFADYSKMLQVVQNLVSNAIKYNKENGRVDIELLEFEESIKINVSDNGIGIPKKDVQNIFNRFYRVDRSRTKKSGGTGLGLAIVKHILDSHHTTIEVTSKLGKGTNFTFSLPKHKRWINEPENQI
jgi:two-component system phosphate regulon sensor histidine kinase PhoR